MKERARLRAPSTRREPAYLVLLALTGVLAAIGLVMVLSSSHVDGLKDTGSSWYFFQRQLLWVAAGIVALVVASRLDYRAWRVLSRPLLLVTLALLVIVLVPGVGISVNGSTRWLGGSSWRIQPSELAKLAVVVALATVFDRRFAEVRDFSRSTRPVLVLMGVILGLVMLQPDMGTTLILGTIGMGLLFVAGTPLYVMGSLAMAGSFLALVAGLLAPYRRERLLSFMDPWADAGNTGYQAIQARVGLSSGGLFGVGLGASRAKWGFLPNAHTDFIFAIIGEEAGLVGALSVVALFIAFAVLGIRTALRAPDRFGCFLAAGITIWVVGQAFLNIGAVIGILPITGVPLPFISFGGSSLVVLMLGVGILLNVARQGRPVQGAPTRDVRRAHAGQ